MPVAVREMTSAAEVLNAVRHQRKIAFGGPLAAPDAHVKAWQRWIEELPDHIRALHRASFSEAEIAARFGLRVTNVRFVLTGRC